MSLGKRLSALLGREQDPSEVLEKSYDRQKQLLQQTRRGAADVATSRRRLELQVQQLEQGADGLRAQAQAAVDAGRDDTARELLGRRAALLSQVADLRPQQELLAGQEEQLQGAVLRLSAKVEAFRGQTQALAAGLSAAEAQTKVTQAIAGVDEELGDVGFALQRARERTESAQARAGALEELAQLSGPALSPGDAAQRTLAELSGGGVEDELAALKNHQPLPGPLSAGSTTAGPNAAQGQQ